MLVAKDRPTTNTHLLAWVDDVAKMCKPDQVYWVDGSDEEAKALTEEAVSTGVLIPLNQQKRPRSFYSRSNPNDVARTEELTFVCTPTKEQAGNTNNWMAPDEAYAKLATKLADKGSIAPDVRDAVVAFFSDPKQPIAVKHDADKWRDTLAAVEKLRSVRAAK